MNFRIINSDVLIALRGMESESIHCVVTSPPYWGLRDYGVEGQLGLENTPDIYTSKMVEVFAEVKRVLRKDGTLWMNMGDSYAGSWGAQSRGNFKDEKSSIEGTAVLHARQIMAFPHLDSGTGSLKRTPGLKNKDLCGIPWRLAFALQADGWYLRSDIIWHKPNPMPESVTDRPTKSHEYLFLISKSEKYFYDQAAILEPCSQGTHARLAQDVQNQIGSDRANGGAKTNGNMKAVFPASYKGSLPGRKGGPGQDRRSTNPRRPKARDVDMGSNRTLVSGYDRKLAEPGSGTKNNSSFDEAMAIMPMERNKRTVWTVPTQSFSEAHFATFPEELVKPCILAGCPEGGTVLDPFAGSGTTGVVALRHHRSFVGIELNPEYAAMAGRRITGDAPMFNVEAPCSE